MMGYNNCKPIASQLVDKREVVREEGVAKSGTNSFLTFVHAVYVNSFQVCIRTYFQVPIRTYRCLQLDPG